jgi:AcrR family transcriptional regulator
MSDLPVGSRVPVTSRGRQTRDALVGAATRLFNERPFEDVTVDEICAGAGVAKGTFYVHFKQKEDVMFAGFATSMEDVADRSESWVQQGLPTTELLSRFARAMRWLESVDNSTLVVTIGEFLARPDDFASYQSKGLPRHQLIPIIELGQHRGDLRTDISAMDAAALIESVWMGTVLRWAQEGGEGSLEPLLQQSLMLALGGLATSTST